MRTCGFILIVLVGLACPACDREHHREEPAARQLGKDAYRASEEMKHAAKKAGQELRKADKEARQGWNEAKREDTSKSKKEKR